MRAESSALDASAGPRARRFPTPAWWASSCSRKSGLPSAAATMRSPRLGRRRLAEPVDQGLGLRLHERLERDQSRRSASASTRPGVSSKQIGAGAEQEQSNGRRGEGRRHTRSGRAASARPSGCRRARRSAVARAASVSNSLRNAPGDLSGEAIPPQAAPGYGALASSSSRRLDPGELLDDLLERPVGDAFAVGEAATDDTRARSAGSSSRGSGATCRFREEPTTVASWGRRFSDCCRRTPADERSSSCSAADERRIDRAREGRDVREELEQAVGRDGLCLPLERRAPRLRSDADAPRARSRLSARRARISPGRAACSRRAATFTASPVTSVSPVPATALAGIDADSHPAGPSSSHAFADRWRCTAVHVARRPRALAGSRRRPSRRRRRTSRPCRRGVRGLCAARRGSATSPRCRTSGSAVSPSAVDPTRSQKTTVTVLWDCRPKG